MPKHTIMCCLFMFFNASPPLPCAGNASPWGGSTALQTVNNMACIVVLRFQLWGVFSHPSEWMKNLSTQGFILFFSKWLLNACFCEFCGSSWLLMRSGQGWTPQQTSHAGRTWRHLVWGYFWVEKVQFLETTLSGEATAFCLKRSPSENQKTTSFLAVFVGK